MSATSDVSTLSRNPSIFVLSYILSIQLQLSQSVSTVCGEHQIQRCHLCCYLFFYFEASPKGARFSALDSLYQELQVAILQGFS